MDIQPKTITEALGLWLGYATGPMFGIVSLLRRARAFHPTGMVFHAMVKPHQNVDSTYIELAKNLSGSALVRLSSSIWKHDTMLPDSLGCSISFRADKAQGSYPSEFGQDLILLTSKSLLFLPVYILTTQQSDFLANQYFSITSFRIADKHEKVKFRLTPQSVQAMGRNRSERMIDALEKNKANFLLEIKSDAPTTSWIPLLDIRLDSVVDINQENLNFSPFRSVAGIEPAGFVNFLRDGPYVFSQFARSKLKRATSIPKGEPDKQVAQRTKEKAY